MTRKSVFIISTEYPPGPGGIGSHAGQISKELHALGWDVKVFTEQANTSNEEIETFNKKSPFKIFRLYPTPNLLSLFFKAIRLFIAALIYRPSLIVGTGKHGAWFAVLTAKLTFTKTALIGHGTEFLISMSKRSRKINNYVYSSADAIIYVSDYTRQVAEKANITNTNNFVIHNGADETLFYRLTETEIKDFLAAQNLGGKKIIITVGNIQDRKGNEWVIRALPEILKYEPATHYFCIGPPSIKAKLEKIAIELNVNEHVHFTGKVSQRDLLLWVNSCDVFAMTSIATDYGDVEGFGIAVIEAALCGKPAVVTSNAGTGEAIIEGVTGFGAKERDTQTIAARIIQLLQNDALRKNMGAQAFQNAKQNLTWSIVAKKYDSVLSALIGKG